MNFSLLFNKIIKYWYYFFVVNAFLRIFGIWNWYSILVIFVAFAGIYAISRIHLNKIDCIVLFAMFYSIISYFFNNYDSQLYYYGIKGQLIAMFFYFIARSKPFKDDSFIDNFKWPMFIVAISGILLYFFPPEWYTQFRYANIEAKEGTGLYYELTRMSSFWPHPYFLGYGSCFLIVYVIKRLLIDKQNSMHLYIILFVSFFTLFYAQMRVSIAYVLLFFVVVFFYNLFIIKNRTLTKVSIIIVFLSFILYSVISSLVDTHFIDYVTGRSTEYEGSLVNDRFELYSKFYQEISLFGNGLGRYGHAAADLKYPYISDNEYLRQLCEIGLFGSFFILFPIFYALYLGFKHMKIVFLETLLLLFFPFAMLGATPLEASAQHCFLLWFCVGHIISKVEKT